MFQWNNKTRNKQFIHKSEGTYTSHQHRYDRYWTGDIVGDIIIYTQET